MILGERDVCELLLLLFLQVVRIGVVVAAAIADRDGLENIAEIIYFERHGVRDARVGQIWLSRRYR